MALLTPRPTVYAGIRMRSRLEGYFAAMLDQGGWEWSYEPECFAGPAGQWVPDFLVTQPALVLPGEAPAVQRTYMEVKPYLAGASPGEDLRIAHQMETAWLSDPAAQLELHRVRITGGSPWIMYRLIGTFHGSEPTWFCQNWRRS